MNIKKSILTGILVSSIGIGTMPAMAQMSPEASVLYQEACSAEHQQDMKEAISLLEKAAAIAGNDTMIYTKLAGLYTEIGENDKALELYKKVISLKPDDAFIYISIGSIYETQAKYKEALQAYEKALDLFPEYKYNYYNIANTQYQLKDYNSAIKNYNAFLETYSQHTESRENLAASYFAVKDYKNAVEQYKTLFDKNQDNFKYYSEYGLSLLNTDEADKAAEMLEKAIERNPDNNAAHLGLAQAYQDLGKNELAYEQYQFVLKKVPNLNTVRLDYANLLANMNKNTEALTQYNMYIQAYPNDVSGYKNIANVYKTLGNYDKALENYLIAEQKTPDDVDIKKDIAFCFHNKKDYNNAVKYYDEILKVQPDDYNIKFNKALALHALHQYEDAIALYKELQTVKNDKAVKDNMNKALVARGHELLEIEDYETAMADFKLAIKEGYMDGSVYYGLAKIYRAQENNTKAAENYEKAISLDPDKTLYSAEYSDFISSLYKPKTTVQEPVSQGSPLPVINIEMENPEKTVSQTKTEETKPQLASPVAIKQNEDLILEGDKNLKNNNYDAAIKNYQDALQLVPSDAETLCKIAYIYKLKEDNMRAINYYQKSIIVNPDYTDSWFNLGLVYINENNFIEAQKSFEHVISLDTDYNSGYAYYALGRALEAQGKKEDAIKNYKLFVKHSNDKETVENVQAQIKQLQK